MFERRQSQPDQWVRWVIGALWLTLVAVLVWQAGSAAFWAAGILLPVLAFYWWIMRASSRRR